MKNKLIKIVDYIIEASILTAVFLTPIYFSFFYQDYPLFSLDKAALFKILTEILFILILIKILFVKRIVFIEKWQIILLPLIFLVGLIFSTVFSLDWQTSFRGSYMRQDGLFIYFHYFLFFLMIIFYLVSFKEEGVKFPWGSLAPSISKKRVGRIINAILAGSFIVSLYGILQWLGIEFIPWQKDIMGGPRVISTMGQPVFLGNYLLLVIFLTVYRILSLRGAPQNAGRRSNLGEPNKQGFRTSFFTRRFSYSFTQVIIYSLLLLSQLLCLVFTYTRGAWLGFIFGSTFALILYFLIITKNILRNILILFTVMVIIGATFFFISFNFGDSPDNLFASRIKSITDFKSGSLAMRMETWKAGLMLWSQSPIIGYGPENQHELFIKYYNPLWSIYEEINSSSDRAHNIILDLLLEGGVILLLLYFIFLGGIIYLAVKKLKEKMDAESFYLLFFLVITIISYHFSLFFSFPMVETNVLFWAYISIIIFLLSDFKIKEIINFKEIKKVYLVLFIYFFIIFASLSVYFIIDNIKSVRADYYFKKGRTAYLRENYPAMLENYIKTFNLNPVQEYYYWFYINDLVNSLNKVDNEGYRRSVFNYFEQILASNFGYISGFQRLYLEIKIYPILGKYIDPSYFKKAELAFKNILELTPFYPDAYYLGGRMYFMEGDYKKALAVYKEALAVLPDLDSPLMNDVLYIEHRAQINRFMINVYLAMIECYDKLGDYKNQIILYNKIISIDLYFLPVYKKIADVYYKEGELDEAIYYNKRGYMLGPNDYAWPYAIALLYKETGNNLKASEYAQKALALNKENEDIKRFIENLNN